MMDEFEPQGSVGETFMEPRADPILAMASHYADACMTAAKTSAQQDRKEFDEAYGEANKKWMALGVALLNLRRESRASQAAAAESVKWFDTNRMRLHTAACSVHEPSARCSCGLHSVLSLTRAIANGNAVLFIDPIAAAGNAVATPSPSNAALPKSNEGAKP